MEACRYARVACLISGHIDWESKTRSRRLYFLLVRQEEFHTLTTVDCTAGQTRGTCIAAEPQGCNALRAVRHNGQSDSREVARSVESRGAEGKSKSAGRRSGGIY